MSYFIASNFLRIASFFKFNNWNDAYTSDANGIAFLMNSKSPLMTRFIPSRVISLIQEQIPIKYASMGMHRMDSVDVGD